MTVVFTWRTAVSHICIGTSNEINERVSSQELSRIRPMMGMNQVGESRNLIDDFIRQRCLV